MVSLNKGTFNILSQSLKLIYISSPLASYVEKITTPKFHYNNNMLTSWVKLHINIEAISRNTTLGRFIFWILQLSKQKVMLTSNQMSPERPCYFIVLLHHLFES